MRVTISRHLDDGDGDGEHQGAEGFADTVRDDLGVVHGGEHGARQTEPDEGDDERRAARGPRPARARPRR